MKTVIFIVFLIIFGLFVYWRMSIVRNLVVPQSPEIRERTEREAEMQSDKYAQPLQDIQKNAKDSYDSLE